MFTIRHQQIQILSKNSRVSFIHKMSEHLRHHFPEDTQSISNSVLHDKIDSALYSAASFGIDSDQDVCRYLNLSLYLGWSFLSDPEYAWVITMLSERGTESVGKRLVEVQRQALFEIESQKAMEEEVMRSGR